jgi:hypothetical protein
MDLRLWYRYRCVAPHCSPRSHPRRCCHLPVPRLSGPGAGAGAVVLAVLVVVPLFCCPVVVDPPGLTAMHGGCWVGFIVLLSSTVQVSST